MRRQMQHFTENIVAENVDRDIRDFYLIDNTEVLGTGVNGAVKVCVHKITKHKYALKVLNLKHLKKDKLNQLREEIKIMSQLGELFEKSKLIF